MGHLLPWTRLLLALFLSGSCVVSYHRASSRFFGASNRLWCSQAKETSESIEPTTYRDDLYEVLGVSADASAREIKKKYLMIVANNHPDRNSTPEALMTFRNATRAYSTLKDPKLKRRYDTKIKTREAMDTLEIVGTEVFEVTKPIVGSAAKAVYEEIVSPLSASAFEVTSAALEASRAAGSTQTGGSTSTGSSNRLVDFDGLRDRWKAAETTFSSVRLQKRKEMTADQLLKTIDALEEARKKITTGEEVLTKLNASLISIETEEKQKILEVEASNTIYEREARRLAESQSTLNASIVLLEEMQGSLSTMGTTLNNTIREKDACTERISDLETQLRQLKAGRATLESTERELQGQIRRQQGRTDLTLKQVYGQERELESLEKTVAAARSVFEEKRTAYSVSQEARESWERSQKEQIDAERVQRGILAQQMKKKETLEATLRSVESEEKARGAN